MELASTPPTRRATTSPLRVGVLGAGAIGEVHSNAIRDVDGVVVVAASGRGHLPPGVDRLTPEQLLAADLDVIAVCTPNAVHSSWARAAIEAGRHVVVEKPLAVTTDAGRQVVETAASAGVRVFGVAQRRLEPLMVQLKSLLDQGALGTVRMAETRVYWWRDDAYFASAPWRRDPASGGSLPNQGLHTLDLLLHFLGRPVTVTAQQATLGHPGLGVEDCLAATISFAGGALATVATSTATPPGLPATISVFTDRGSLELRHDSLARWDFPHPEPAPARRENASTGASDPTAIGSIGHRDLWVEVRDAIRDGRPSPVDGTEALRTVAVIEAIQRSAAAGVAVAVAGDPGGSRS